MKIVHNMFEGRTPASDSVALTVETQWQVMQCKTVNFTLKKCKPKMYRVGEELVGFGDRETIGIN